MNDDIVFNCWKHHLNFVLEHIMATRDNSNRSGLFHIAPTELIAIGNNTFDLYTGSLSVTGIYSQVSGYLNKKGITTPEAYNLWLGAAGYKKIKLTDHSEWILRYGTQTNKYVHIHPSRSGSYTMRFKGSSWKTAILIILQNFSIETLSLEQLNLARKSLGLSPVKKISPETDIWQTFQFLDQEINKPD